MAENAVEDDADSFFSRLAAEVRKFLVRPQKRIDFFVIAGIVTVIAFRLEDGIEIDDGDAHLFQIRKLLPHAGDIAAVKVVSDNLFRVRILIIARCVLPRSVNHRAALLFLDNVFAIKTVGENLIHHRTAEPRRRRRANIVDRDLKRAGRHIRNAALSAQAADVPVKADPALIHEKDEIVPQKPAFLRQVEHRAQPTPAVKRRQRISRCLLHVPVVLRADILRQRNQRLAYAVAPNAHLPPDGRRPFHIERKAHLSSRLHGSHGKAKRRIPGIMPDFEFRSQLSSHP